MWIVERYYLYFKDETGEFWEQSDIKEIIDHSDEKPKNFLRTSTAKKWGFLQKQNAQRRGYAQALHQNAKVKPLYIEVTLYELEM